MVRSLYFNYKSFLKWMDDRYPTKESIPLFKDLYASLSSEHINERTNKPFTPSTVYGWLRKYLGNKGYTPKSRSNRRIRKKIVG